MPCTRPHYSAKPYPGALTKQVLYGHLKTRPLSFDLPIKFEPLLNCSMADGRGRLAHGQGITNHTFFDNANFAA